MNKERIKEKAFPFTYDGWDEACGDYGDIQFYNVEFVEDFGPIKTGDKFDCVVVYHCQGKIACINNGKADESGFRPQSNEIVVNFKVVSA